MSKGECQGEGKCNGVAQQTGALHTTFVRGGGVGGSCNVDGGGGGVDGVGTGGGIAAWREGFGRVFSESGHREHGSQHTPL